MDRWPGFDPAKSLRETSKPLDEYIKKLENRLSAMDNHLKTAKEEAEKMQMERDIAVKELSIISAKYAKLEEKQAIQQSIEASIGLHNAFETAQFVMRQVRNHGSVREDPKDLSKDLEAEALKQELEELLVHNEIIAKELRNEQEENEKLRGDIANLQTDLEILQSVSIRFRNIFRDFAQNAQSNFQDTDQIIGSISGSRPPSSAFVSQSSIQGSVDANTGDQSELFGSEGAANVSFDNGMNQACGPVDEEIIPDVFFDAVSKITPEEMAALEKAFENV